MTKNNTDKAKERIRKQAQICAQVAKVQGGLNKAK